MWSAAFFQIICANFSFFTTGRPGWGIAWYIDGLLVPQLNLTRGQNYTFRVFGGDNDDIANRASYHPFYITDSLSGGRLLNSQAQRMVTVHFVQRRHILFTCTLYRMKQYMQALITGINQLEVSFKSTSASCFSPLFVYAVGTFCSFNEGNTSPTIRQQCGTIQQYLGSLGKTCDQNPPTAGEIVFSPDDTTPDVVYYQVWKSETFNAYTSV